MNHHSKALLQSISKTADMGRSSLSQLLHACRDNAFCEVLRRQYDDSNRICLSAAALLLGLLLPQLLEQGQVLVEIIGVQQRLIVFCQRCLYPRRDGQLLRFDACKVGFRLLCRGTGRRAPSFAVGI